MTNNNNFKNLFDQETCRAHSIALANALTRQQELTVEMEKARTDHNSKVWRLQHCFNNNITAFKNATDEEIAESIELYTYYKLSLRDEYNSICKVIESIENTIDAFFKNNNDLGLGPTLPKR